MAQELPLVLVKGTGSAGLGDLIRTVLSGLHYAMLAGRRIHIDWNDGLYGSRGNNVFTELLELIGAPWERGTVEFWKTCSANPGLWARKLDESLATLYKTHRQDEWNRSWALANLSFDQTRFDYEEDVLVMWDFDGFHASWSAADRDRRLGASAQEALSLLATRHLRPAPELRERVESFKARRFRDKMVGVHIRKTFEKGGVGKQVDERSFLKAIDAVRKRLPGAGIFLATDNMDVEKELCERYADVVTTDKWFPNPGTAMHFAENIPDRLKCAKDAVVDMFMLASCDYLIYPASSSFSQAARYVSDLPDDRVVPLYKLDGIRARWAQMKRLKALRADVADDRPPVDGAGMS